MNESNQDTSVQTLAACYKTVEQMNKEKRLSIDVSILSFCVSRRRRRTPHFKTLGADLRGSRGRARVMTWLSAKKELKGNIYVRYM